MMASFFVLFELVNKKRLKKLLSNDIEIIFATAIQFILKLNREETFLL